MKREVSAPNSWLQYCTAGLKCWFELDCLRVQQDNLLTNHLIHANEPQPGSRVMRHLAVELPGLWCGHAWLTLLQW